jgi:predicted amidohydrolase YtcJ
MFRTILAIAAICASCALAAAEAPADLVVLNAKIYTAGPSHSRAEALAVRNGRIVFAGSDGEAQAWIGSGTKVERLGGKLVLPGLIDSHIHPEAIVDLDVCDLRSEPKSLKALTEFVRGCIARYKVPAGEWVNVRQWNFSINNLPDAAHPTLRVALDLASRQHPIQLLGNDGHHGAYNSAALALAVDHRGERVGLSRASLTTDFAREAKLVGVDASGEPNGTVNEDARSLMGAANLLFVDLPQVMKVPERITERLNAAGITGILDAAAAPEVLPLYDMLEERGRLTVRTVLAQFLDPESFRNAAGEVDWARMVSIASGIRAKYAKDPLIRANFVKLFADGVLEGNPFATPPTLPDAAATRPFLQPIFGRDGQGHATVTGYVDTTSELCRSVRAHESQYASSEDVSRFMAAHGYHPAQCTITSGQLQHERAIIMEFARQFHLAGFTLHIHAVADGGARAAVDAIEAARAADGVSTLHDSIAHVQVVDPDDVARIGRDHLYIACTLSWAVSDPEDDITVVPFYDHVSGNTSTQLHQPDFYYEHAVYPFKSLKDAGGIIVAGSDAPVNTRDPQPFVNIAVAIARQYPGHDVLTPGQRLSIEDAIDAYTINGARFLSLDSDAGSLEVGKSADFIVLDRDILRLAAGKQPLRIAETRVVETWFQGRKVFHR